MSRTVQDLMEQALGLIGALRASSSMSSDESARNLIHMNLMLGNWKLDRVTFNYLTRENFTLTVSTDSYTIGSGGTFNTVRPLDIENAWLRDSNNNEYPLDIITRSDYDLYTDREITTARPCKLYYDPQPTLGIIYLYEPPAYADVLYIESWKPFTEFAAITETITLPPGVEWAIVTNWAIAVCPFYNVNASPELIQTAKLAWDKMINHYAEEPQEAKFNYFTGGGAFDVKSGEFL